MELDFSRDVLEKYLFKKILTDKHYMNAISDVFDKRWIKNKDLSTLIILSINFFKKYDKIPNPSIVKLLGKKLIEKGKIESTESEINEVVDSSFNPNYTIDEEVFDENVKDFIRKQALFTSIVDNVDDIEKNSDEVLDKCLARFDKVQKIVFNDKDLGMNYFSEDDMIKHWDYINNPEAKISTGWDSIDKFTNGGFFKKGKMLALFAGQAGLGKSLFLSNLAVNMLRQNLKVVVISLEMSQDVYAQRFDAHISGDDVNHLKESSERSINTIKNFYKDHPEANLFIKEYPPRSIRTSDIETYLENLKLAGHDFDVVIVDYLNLILAQRTSDNMFKDGLEVSEKLRALSYKFECPVITATQVNTEGMNNENVDMQNISESRGIAHTADFIGGLYQMPEDRENGIINMRILKNRLGGMVGKISNFQLNSETLILTDISFDPNNQISQALNNPANNVIKNLSGISQDLDSI